VPNGQDFEETGEMKATSVFQANGPRRRVREDLVRKFMRRYGAGAARGTKPPNANGR
jgi:hypothetical protein